MNRDDEEDIGSQDTMDINVIILIFPNPTFSGNMVTHKVATSGPQGKWPLKFRELLIDGAAIVQEDNGTNIPYN